jgi:hypothetical protein
MRAAALGALNPQFSLVFGCVRLRSASELLASFFWQFKMSADWLKDLLIGSLTWELIVRLLAISYLSDIIWWPLGKFFGIFKTKLQATLFLGLFPLAIFLVFVAFSSATSMQPRLRGEVVRLIIFNGDEDRLKNFAAVSLRIYNRGNAPSAADSFDVHTKVVDTDFRAEMIVPTGDLKMAIGTRISPVKETDLIAEKMLSPLPPGSFITGYVIFSFRGIRKGYLADNPVKLTISFKDAFGATSSVEASSDLSGKDSLNVFVPGLDSAN